MLLDALSQDTPRIAQCFVMDDCSKSGMSASWSPDCRSGITASRGPGHAPVWTAEDFEGTLSCVSRLCSSQEVLNEL